MVEVDLTSKTWDSVPQLLAWRLSIGGPIAGASLAICLFAQIIFYIFPRLRVFPRSLLSWLNWYNIFFEIYIILKWSPYSALNSEWILHVTKDSFLCHFGLFWDQVFLIGPMACTTLICLTVFLLIVVRVDIENKRPFFWGYLAFATIYPIAVALPVSTTNATLKGWGTCVNGNQSLLLGLRSVYLALTIIQVLFLICTFVYIKRVFNENNSTASGSFPAKYLFIRFFISFLAQTFGLLPAQVMDAFPKIAIENAIYFRFAVVSRYLGPALDALVLLFGNVDFTDWIKLKLSAYIKHPYFSTPTTSNSEEKPISLEKRINMTVGVEAEDMRLADASSAMGTSRPKHLTLGDLKTTEVEDDSMESKEEV